MDEVASIPSVMLATPCYGGLVTQLYMQSVMALSAEASRVGLPLSLALLGQDALITRSRNTLVARFLRSDATHLLFVDADIAFAASDVFALLTRRKEVVGAPYPVRQLAWDAATMARVRAGEPVALAALRYVGEPCGNIGTDGLLPARYAGTGFLLIARTAIDRLIAAYPETRCRHNHVAGGGAPEEAWALFDCVIDRDTGDYLSEDFAFCARWRGIGGTLWLDPSVRLTHAGMSEFEGRPDLRWPHRPSEAVA